MEALTKLSLLSVTIHCIDCDFRLFFPFPETHFLNPHFADEGPAQELPVFRPHVVSVM